MSRIINPLLGGQIAFCVDRYNEGSTMEQINLKTAATVVENMKKLYYSCCSYAAPHTGVLMDYMVELEKITKRQLLVSETAGLATINYNVSGKKSASQYADHLLQKYYGRNAK